MKIFLYSIVVCLYSSIFLLSCNTKTEREKLEENYNEEYCKALVDSVLSDYMDYRWDSICYYVYIPEQKDQEPMLIINGQVKSKTYNNEEFQVHSFWNIDGVQKGNTFSNLDVYHKEIGQIISITNGHPIYDSIMDCTEFNQKMVEYSYKMEERRQLSLQAAKEREDAVRLANKNKTKVHFGMSELDYYSAGEDYQKNFIDGLIGKGAYELANPIFGKGKFVGFEIHSKHGISCNHANIYSYAKEVRSHSSDVNRFHSNESDYVSKLYNLRIYELYNRSSGECSESITVWWNSYIKRYN